MESRHRDNCTGCGCCTCHLNPWGEVIYLELLLADRLAEADTFLRTGVLA